MDKEQEIISEIILTQALPGVPEYYRRETPWHRNWKLAFPKAYREISFFDEIAREIHRADVCTSCNTVIEFQNSPISLTELQSREAYYPKLIWVLNGKKFKGFKVLKHLPDVDDPKLTEFEFCHSDHLSMVRKVDVKNGVLKPKILNFYHPEIKNIAFTSHYYSFCWKHPHIAWHAAKAPIIIDLGGHFLYELKHRKQLSGNYPYLKIISRKVFIEQYI